MGKAQNVFVDFHKKKERKKEIESVHYKAFKTPPTCPHAKET